MTRHGHDLVDSHVHVFTRSYGLGLSWMDDESGSLGDADLLREHDWDPPKLEAEVGNGGVDTFVHVQASDGPDPVAETRWLAGLAPSWPRLGALVARTDLAAPGIDAQLDAHLDASSLIRGVRDLGPLMTGFDAAALAPGLAALTERNLCWEVQCVWEQAKGVLDCLRAQPELLAMITHAGFPLGRDDDYRRGWEAAMREFAALPNVYCKLSGLGMGDHDWSPGDWQPWLAICLDAFGPARCAFGSNFPVDRLYASYEEVLDEVEAATADLSEDEREQVFAGTATKFYRLDGHSPKQS
jgi:predicted TIM-barrel fold metal-dependent hydrolase